MTKSKRKTKETKETKFNYNLIFLVILLLFGLFNVAQLYSTKNTVDNQLNLATQKAKPAQISLTIIDINKEECSKCIDINKVTKLITDSQKTNVTKFVNKNYKDKDIQTKIKELSITKFPALIIEGNVNQSEFLMRNIEKITKKINDETYVFTPIEAPYLDGTGNLIGKIDIITLYNKDCIDCSDISLLEDEVNNLPIEVNEIKRIDINSLEGKSIVSKYNVEKVPTLLFSKELKDYTSISSNWEKGAGSIETDGTYVLRSISPIYYSILENRAVGKITMTILSDSNCNNCFNGSEIYPAIMSKLEIRSFKTISLDTTSKEGIDLINKYKLEKFPMMIIEGDTNTYPNLKQVWGQVGTIEDNKFLLRNVELLGLPYFDTNHGEVTPTEN